MAASPSSSGEVVTVLRLRLYVAGVAPHSRRAFANLNAALNAIGLQEVDLEVVDVLELPKRAFEDGIVVTPTLVRLTDGDPVLLIGSLEDTNALIHFLSL